MNKFSKAALAAGLSAMVATTPLPAIAATGVSTSVRTTDGATYYGEASDYHRRHWRKRRLDVDAGDVILGIGLIAAIAAVANSAEKNRRNRSGDEYPRDADYDREPEPSFRGNDDVGSAVSACTDAAERTNNGHVDEIASVTRDGNGWRVEGEIGKDNFVCTFADGRVDDIRIGDREI